MKTTHWENCNTPLCKDMEKEYWETAIWYRGEEICKGQKQTEFQKEQKYINRSLSKGYRRYHGHEFFTANVLEDLRKIRKSKYSSRIPVFVKK